MSSSLKRFMILPAASSLPSLARMILIVSSSASKIVSKPSRMWMRFLSSASRYSNRRCVTLMRKSRKCSSISLTPHFFGCGGAPVGTVPSAISSGGTDIVITSMPYAMSKSDLVQKIADVIIGRKLPYLVDVRDESTTDVRIVLEIKKDAAPAIVMAYLYKHTPLQSSFHVNLTCLVPPELMD